MGGSRGAQRQVVEVRHGQAGQRGGRVGAQPGHRTGDHARVRDADRQLVGGVQPVLAGEVVEHVVHGPALGLQRRGELDDEQRRADAVLVGDVRGVDAVAEGLLVAEREVGRPGRST